MLCLVINGHGMHTINIIIYNTIIIILYVYSKYTIKIIIMREVKGGGDGELFTI